MSPYNGIESMYSVDGMPYKTKLPEKPMGVGNELKIVSDGMTKIMLFMELQEGKKVMSSKRWYKEYGAATSWVLRLCDN